MFFLLWTPVRADLARKMVFIGGPRQVGKTTFALSSLGTPPRDETHPAYMNWDRGEHRDRLLSGEIPSGTSNGKIPATAGFTSGQARRAGRQSERTVSPRMSAVKSSSRIAMTPMSVNL